MKKVWNLFIVVLLVSLMIVSGCSSSKTASSTKGQKGQGSGKVTISFMGWGNQEEHDIYSQVLADFEKAYPNIKVDYIYVPQDYDTKLKTMVAGGTPPDVLYIHESTGAEWAKAGMLWNLDPYIKKYPELTEGMPPGLLKYGQYEGKQYGIPKDFAPWVVYVNVDIFKKAGIPLPTSDWTMDDFVNLARKLTVKQNGKVQQWGTVIDEWWGPWMLFLGTENGQWFKDGKSNFSDPGVMKGLKILYDLMVTYKAAPSPSTLKSMGVGQSQMFETGKVAMYPMGRWMTPTFRQSVKFNWEAVELPKGSNGQRYSPVNCGMFGISANSKHKEEALTLIRYLLSKDALKKVASLGLALPPYTKYLDDPSFVTSPPDPAPFKAAANYLDRTGTEYNAYYSTKFTEYDTKYIEPELDKLYNGQQTVEQTAENIDKGANANLFK
ncbi:ABC transporter substrate-binding protein [Caldanaerobius polysaccharolyticus]|uniref:ABC transporter substrate-binding protein n=1 Tax=Caldanaerobius polysaccharolyticus TaxID=44256 RepID=UPI00047DE2A0|nr:sugar ABC transporter substrate-binding protein [Caldanaerobius polysaccharolyticus]